MADNAAPWVFDEADRLIRFSQLVIRCHKAQGTKSGQPETETKVDRLIGSLPKTVKFESKKKDGEDKTELKSLVNALNDLLSATSVDDSKVKKLLDEVASAQLQCEILNTKELLSTKQYDMISFPNWGGTTIPGTVLEIDYKGKGLIDEAVIASKKKKKIDRLATAFKEHGNGGTEADWQQLAKSLVDFVEEQSVKSLVEADRLSNLFQKVSAQAGGLTFDRTRIDEAAESAAKKFNKQRDVEEIELALRYAEDKVGSESEWKQWAKEIYECRSSDPLPLSDRITDARQALRSSLIDLKNRISQFKTVDAQKGLGLNAKWDLPISDELQKRLNELEPATNTEAVCFEEVGLAVQNSSVQIQSKNNEPYSINGRSNPGVSVTIPNDFRFEDTLHRAAMKEATIDAQFVVISADQGSEQMRWCQEEGMPYLSGSQFDKVKSCHKEHLSLLGGNRQVMLLIRSVLYCLDEETRLVNAQRRYLGFQLGLAETISESCLQGFLKDFRNRLQGELGAFAENLSAVQSIRLEKAIEMFESTLESASHVGGCTAFIEPDNVSLKPDDKSQQFWKPTLQLTLAQDRSASVPGNPTEGTDNPTKVSLENFWDHFDKEQREEDSDTPNQKRAKLSQKELRDHYREFFDKLEENVLAPESSLIQSAIGVDPVRAEPQDSVTPRPKEEALLKDFFDPAPETNASLKHLGTIRKLIPKRTTLENFDRDNLKLYGGLLKEATAIPGKVLAGIFILFAPFILFGFNNPLKSLVKDTGAGTTLDLWIALTTVSVAATLVFLVVGCAQLIVLARKDSEPRRKVFAWGVGGVLGLVIWLIIAIFSDLLLLTPYEKSIVAENAGSTDITSSQASKQSDGFNNFLARIKGLKGNQVLSILDSKDTLLEAISSGSGEQGLSSEDDALIGGLMLELQKLLKKNESVELSAAKSWQTLADEIISASATEMESKKAESKLKVLWALVESQFFQEKAKVFTATYPDTNTNNFNTQQSKNGWLNKLEKQAAVGLLTEFNGKRGQDGKLSWTKFLELPDGTATLFRNCDFKKQVADALLVGLTGSDGSAPLVAVISEAMKGEGGLTKGDVFKMANDNGVLREKYLEGLKTNLSIKEIGSQSYGWYIWLWFFFVSIWSVALLLIACVLLPFFFDKIPVAVAFAAALLGVSLLCSSYSIESSHNESSIAKWTLQMQTDASEDVWFSHNSPARSYLLGLLDCPFKWFHLSQSWDPRPDNHPAGHDSPWWTVGPCLVLVASLLACFVFARSAHERNVTQKLTEANQFVKQSLIASFRKAVNDHKKKSEAELKRFLSVWLDINFRKAEFELENHHRNKVRELSTGKESITRQIVIVDHREKQLHQLSESINDVLKNATKLRDEVIDVLNSFGTKRETRG